MGEVPFRWEGISRLVKEKGCAAGIGRAVSLLSVSTRRCLVMATCRCSTMAEIESTARSTRFPQFRI
jgi:hypothetical protein